MAWFDGTVDTEMQELIREYPVQITDDLRMSEDRAKLALINRFEEGSLLYTLADPHMEAEESDGHDFSHTFTGADAAAARSEIARYASQGRGNNGGDILLLRQDGDRLFNYANGELRCDMIAEQNALQEPFSKEMRDGGVFVLPLRVYRYPCPVCSKRTLTWRHNWDICPECGWEDERVYDDDDDCNANNESVNTYRRRYMRKKRANPFYTWLGEATGCFLPDDEDEDGGEPS